MWGGLEQLDIGDRPELNIAIAKENEMNTDQVPDSERVGLVALETQDELVGLYRESHP